MITAEEANKLSEDREAQRKKYWEDFDNIIDQEHVALIEKAIKNPTNIYWRTADLDFKIGNATKKHIENLGYYVYFPINTNGGPAMVIKW